MIIKLPQYLTNTKLYYLYKIAKKLNIHIKKRNKKIEIINKINLKLLHLYKKDDLIYIINLYNLKIKNNTKIKLIYLINQYIRKNKKYNLISIFYNNQFNNQFNTVTNKLINNTVINNKFNNESFGITCEYVLCLVFNLDNNLKSRININYINILTAVLHKFKINFDSINNLKCIEFIGYKNLSYDFICQNNITKKLYTLSVKSNINNKYLICPQKIGQCTILSFINQIKLIKKFKNIKLKSLYSIKRFIIKNIEYLLPIYYKNLFCCDYLLWIFKLKNDINYKLFNKKKYIDWDKSNLRFTNKLNNWKECNTLKYNNLSIGIFQIHNNRNCIKFRFYFKNLLKIHNLS